MNAYDIKRLALIQALVFEVEAMKTENKRRSTQDRADAYDEAALWDKAEEMRELAYKHNDQL